MDYYKESLKLHEKAKGKWEMGIKVPVETKEDLSLAYTPGVAQPDILSEDMIRSMKVNPAIFAMSNPEPEIKPELAKQAGAAIIGTGRSDYPNQINNLLAFPGIFRGALDARAESVTEEMKLAAAKAIAYTIKDEELSADAIIPSPLNENVEKNVAAAVAEAAGK